MIRVVKDASFLALFLLGAVGVAGSGILGCSSAADAPSDAEREAAGSIGLDLQIGGGLTLNQASYVIVGPGGFSKSGTLQLSNSTVLSAVISGLPAGAGYSVTLSGTTSDGGTVCVGSATFNVIAQQTTVASVHLACHQTPVQGSVQVNGTLNVCPIAGGIGAEPAEVVTGSTVLLSASAFDADNGPSPLTYSWTASSGVLSDATLATPTFTCTVPGTVTIAVTVSDGDAAPGCADSTSVTVTCTPSTADVQSIVNANCTSCHSGLTPPRGLSLVDVRAAIGVSAVECALKRRILSGSATQSYLVDKILGAAQDGGCFSGRQMPIGKPPLSLADIALISSWINAGTP